MTISIQFDLPLNVSQSIDSEGEGQAKIAYVMTLLKHGEPEAEEDLKGRSSDNLGML